MTLYTLIGLIFFVLLSGSATMVVAKRRGRKHPLVWFFFGAAVNVIALIVAARPKIRRKE